MRLALDLRIFVRSMDWDFHPPRSAPMWLSRAEILSVHRTAQALLDQLRVELGHAAPPDDDRTDPRVAFDLDILRAHQPRLVVGARTVLAPRDEFVEELSTVGIFVGPVLDGRPVATRLDFPVPSMRDTFLLTARTLGVRGLRQQDHDRVVGEAVSVGVGAVRLAQEDLDVGFQRLDWTHRQRMKAGAARRPLDRFIAAALKAGEPVDQLVAQVEAGAGEGAGARNRTFPT